MNLFSSAGKLIMAIRKSRSEIIEDAKASVRNGKALAEFFRTHEVSKLDLGATTRRTGFITADLSTDAELNFDFAKPFPIPDESFDFVYCSHVLEHFFYNDLIKLLYQVRRIMKPDAVFSICVPNARIYIESYLSAEPFDIQHWCTYKPALNYHSKIDVINYMAYMDGQHRMMYDENNLPAILAAVGFTNIRQRQFEQGLDLPERRQESIYFQCEK